MGCVIGGLVGIFREKQTRSIPVAEQAFFREPRIGFPRAGAFPDT